METGQIKPATRSTSNPAANPVFVGAIIGASGLLGLLLQDTLDVVEEEVTTGRAPAVLAESPLDDNTKVALQVVLALIAGTALVGGTFSFVKNVQERASAAAEYVFKVGGLALAFFLIAKFVLEN